MGSDVPKQFLLVDEKPIIVHVLEKFDTHDEIDGIVVVCKEDLIAECQGYINRFNLRKVIGVVPGGRTGQESIFNGLKHLVSKVSHNPSSDVVLIHDGVRPLIDHDLISRSILCVRNNGNSIAVSPSIETVIEVDDDGHIVRTINRSNCRNAKAPQCFVLNAIWSNHLKAKDDGLCDIVDSATLMSLYGEKLFTTDCAIDNIKITTPKDYFMFKGLYQAQQSNLHSEPADDRGGK